MDKVYIIAEAGVNHDGSFNQAKKLVDIAADAGADAVKFQTFKAKNLVSRFAEKAAYQKETTDPSESQLEMIQKLELSEEDQNDLVKYCEEKKIEFLSSPFDLESIDFLHKLGQTTFKIPSGEINNLPYLRKIAKVAKKVIASTGMSDLNEIKELVKTLEKEGVKKEDLTLLHCNTEYPTPFSDVNLKAMLTIGKELKTTIGYSDHTAGIEIPIAATALGAKVIEKHFTLDKSLPGPDHKASLDPLELKVMVQSIRNIEISLGTGEKKPSPSEIKNKEIARKSIVAKSPIAKGETFTEENITTKRPALGISPMEWDNVIGKKASRDFQEDEFIKL